MIFFEDGPLPQTAPVADEELIKWSFALNKIYETGARWSVMEPRLESLAKGKQDDVRSYYYLNHEENLSDKLSHFSMLPNEKRQQLKEWLAGICYNKTGNESACVAKVNASAAAAEDLNSILNAYFADAKELWNSYFELEEVRSDVDWNASHEKVLDVPFLLPERDEVKAYLQENIEEEWKWNDWQLKLNFTPVASPLTPFIVFVAGATAHAELAGAKIVLNANLPVTEYSSRWTIRHEFGHTMGFPDCYVEFYDKDKEMITSYQLDVENLMCSRRGKFNQSMFNELKKKYFQE